MILSTGPVVLFLLAVSAGTAKGIIDTLRNDYQQLIPSVYSSVQCSADEAQIPTALEKPPVNLQGDSSAPRVVGHTYHIFKTILRPQLFRQMVIVPYLQRYIRTFQAPVLETVHIQREIPF